MEEALFDTSKLIDIYMKKEPAYGKVASLVRGMSCSSIHEWIT